VGPRARGLAMCLLALSCLGPSLSAVQEVRAPELTAEERAWLDEHDRIRVGPAPNFPPIEFFDEAGNFAGIAAEYAALFEDRLGIEFEIQRLAAWNDVVEATQRREIDVWLEAADNEERREYMLFTEPYLFIPSLIIVREDEHDELTIEDLAGRRVVATAGYAVVDYLRETVPGIDLITVPSIEAGLQRVSFGSADALVASSASASFYIERLGLTNLRVAGESGWTWELSIGSRSDWPLLHSILAKTLETIGQEERRAIYRRWVSFEAEASDGIPRWAIWVGGLVLLILVVLLVLRRSGGTAATDLRTGILATWPVYLVGTAVIVVIMTTNWWADRRITIRMQNDVGDALQTVLRTTSEAVYHFFREREEEALVWAGHEDVRSICRTLESSPSPASSAHSSLRAQLKSLLEERGYLGFLVLNPDGTVLASDDGRMVGQPAASTGVLSLLEKILDNPRRASVSLPQREPDVKGASDDDRVTMMLGAAAPDLGDGVPCVLTLLMDPQRSFSEILQRGRIGESGESYAFNRNGLLISESRFEEDLRRIGMIGEDQTGILNVEIRDPGGSLVRGHRPDRPRAEQPFTTMAMSATSGRTDMNLDGYNDYRGVPVIGAWTWDENTGLGITTEINVDEAYASLFWVHRMFQGGTILIVLLVAALMVAFTLHNIRRLRIEVQLNRQSAALKATVDGIAITATDGTIRWVNPAFSRLTGYSVDETVGSNPRVLKSGVHGPEFYRSMWNTINAGNVWNGEVVNRRKDGSTYTEEMSITPVRNQEGAIVDFVAIKRDITERKLMEAELERARKRMEDELNVGREIQMSMLPLTFPAFPERQEFDVFATLDPAREVGGDFYDFFFVDENRFCVCVGDVSGKGVPSALFMAVTKTLLKSNASMSGSTAAIISHVNTEVSRENKESMFVTAFIGILDVRSGDLVYTNAGHNPPFLKRRDGSIERIGKRHGPVIGAVEDLHYKEDRLTVEPGDLLLLYTDGVTEAMNPKSELFRESRLLEVLRSSGAATASSQVQATVDAVKKFEGAAEQADDITVLALGYRGNNRSDGVASHTIMMNGDPEQIGSSIEQFDDFARRHDLPDTVTRKVKIALDDVLQNIVSYGYPEAINRDIEVSMALSDRQLTLTVSDNGVAFNPLEQASPRTDQRLEQREIGGLGLHLVRNLADNLVYCREDGRNILKLVFEFLSGQD
jgi:sigma-B regulation protein RsbU (phosphoserine phosphatase)